MIRINLKRGEETPRASGKFFGIDQSLSKVLGKIAVDFGSLVVVLTAGALAGLPHIMMSQYQIVMTEQNEKAVKRVEDSIRSLNQEIEKFTPFQKELESYEQQKESVKTRLSVVERLIMSRGTPVSLLSAFGQSLPPRTWISNLDINLGGKDPEIKVSGVSFLNEEISDLIDKLAESVYFTDIKLEEVTSGKTADGKLEVRNFKLSIKTRGSSLAPQTALTAVNKANL